MNIQQHAQNILDLCTAGPIQGGISIEIKREAQAIVDSFEWFDCNEKRPKDEQLVKVIYQDGSENIDWFDVQCGWQNVLNDEPVKWRELI